MLAIGWGRRYLYPLTMVDVCMLKIAHFFAVTCDSVTYLSILSRLGMLDAGSFIWIGCGRTAFVSRGRQSLSAAKALELIARSRMNSSGLSCRGFRWKIVLWNRVVSYLRCYLLWGSGYSAIVFIFFTENEGRKDLRCLGGEEGSVFSGWVLFTDGIDYIMIDINAMDWMHAYEEENYSLLQR